jgi:hypothetical protein
MSIKIRRDDERTIYVNDKLVRMDADNNWIAPFDELTNSETKSFHEYLNSEKLDFKNRLN